MRHWLQHFPRFSKQIILLGVGICVLPSTGCEQFTAPTSNSAPKITKVAEDHPTVWAQGKLLPAGGIIQIAGIPGDRLEEILVKPGQPIEEGSPLVRLASEAARSGELELAKERLIEAKKQLEGKQIEANSKLQLALTQQTQAQTQLRLAQEQLELADTGDKQIEGARDNLERMKALQSDPRTKIMVGTIDYEQKKIEFAQAEAKQRQAKLLARQACDNAKLATDLADQQVIAARKGLELIDSSSPLQSAETQVKLLEQQLARTKLLSPCDGIVLSITSDVGEAVMQLPIMEVADISKMVCRAEVHESDLKRIQLDCRAELQSSALSKSLQGKIVRIDRMVGNPEMRIPDPLAKTDFRAVPVWIEIDSEYVEEASHFIQLQVQVSIQTR